MFNNFNICYDECRNVLTIVKNTQKHAIQKIEGKYGIEIWCDINETPISIIIPEPDVLFGLNRNYLLKLVCSNLT